MIRLCRRAVVCLGSLAFAAGLPPITAVEDLPALISRADLHYARPPARSEDGLPLGNGRMGSLVWTSPAAIHLQVNRNDVQAINKDSRSFVERHTDYTGGCAFLDIDLRIAAGDVFSETECPQHLAIHDGLLTLDSPGVTSRLLAHPDHDVFAIELADHRPAPQVLTVRLRMLRFLTHHDGARYEDLQRGHAVVVRTGNHTATSQLIVRGDRIVLAQEFREGSHVAKSAVAVAIAGRPTHPQYVGATGLQLVAPAGSGPVLILVASAATLDPAEDVTAAALRQLDAAAHCSFPTLARETAAWWHAFWKRGSVDLRSADGSAEYVADHYHYFLYLMAASSRGTYPTKFNGMLWNTAGDLRTWGAQHWFANLSCLYEALFASNRLELLDGLFDMYGGMHDAAALAARQQWDSAGIFIPETVWFDGLASLPEPIATEMSELYLLRRPWAERSPAFVNHARTQHPHSSRWNWWGGGEWIDGQWAPSEREHPPFGPVTHILGTTAKVAYLFWRRYEYTLDRDWLRTRAYPMLRGAAEFYRTFPNLRREADGRLHMHHTNSNEGVQDVRDSDEDHAAMRGIFAVAARAAEILDLDADLRVRWLDTLADLAPLPTSTDPDALKPTGYDGPPVLVRGRHPVGVPRGFTPDSNSLPHFFFDLCNLDSPDESLRTLATNTFAHGLRHQAIGPETPIGVLSKTAIAGATLGRADATRYLIANQIRSLQAERGSAYGQGRPLANRLALREGTQAFDAQRLGRAAEALQLALLNSSPPAPGAEPILRLFAAWPADWDAHFTLRARGAFVVSASRQTGIVAPITVHSEAGATLRLHNPWDHDTPVKLTRGDGSTVLLRDPILSTATHRDERLHFAPESASTP